MLFRMLVELPEAIRLWQEAEAAERRDPDSAATTA
jgi:hypothetical protein